MDKSVTLTYYKQQAIQREILESGRNREVAVRYNDIFGKRPDTLAYESDILELAKQGATSFHISEERWENPLLLQPQMLKKDLDSLRTGWDLVLDIDTRAFELSRYAADLVVKALQSKGISAISVKFSGNKGFHIGVPFSSFPDRIKAGRDIETKDYFPDGPRMIAAYLKEMIRQPLSDSFMRLGINSIVSLSGVPFADIVKDNKVNPFKVVDIDTVLISSRHMFRAPYSLHEKSGLVSLPIQPGDILKFKRESANPLAVKPSISFLSEKNTKKDAARLFDDAIYQMLSQQQQESKKPQATDFTAPEIAIKKELFPPCMLTMLSGMGDGRKRGMFAMVNFLIGVGWKKEEIEALLLGWDKVNAEPLGEKNIITHVRYSCQKKEKILPPNCRGYYEDLTVCKPDALCKYVKNPVNYAVRKARRQDEDAKKDSRARKKQEGA